MTEDLIARKLIEGAQKREQAAGHEALAGSFVDAVEGRNPAFNLSSAGNRHEAAILSIYARILPFPLSQIARDRLLAMTDIAQRVQDIPGILRHPPSDGEAGVAGKLGKLFGGSQ